MDWGAFQGIQATVIQALILLLVGLIVVADLPSSLALGIGTLAFLVFIYSLWAALDTLLGYHFRYFGIGRLLDRVSTVNLGRPERKRGWFGVKTPEDNGPHRP